MGRDAVITPEIIEMAHSLAKWAQTCGLSSLTVSTVVEDDGEPYISVRALDGEGSSETWAVMRSA